MFLVSETKNVSATASGKTTTDKDKIARVINADDMQVSHCDTLVWVDNKPEAT